MAIEVTCESCHRSMMLTDACAGKKGLCPHCKAVLIVPAATAPPPPAEEFIAPTEKQIAYAMTLGIEIPEGMSRKQLSAMIDAAKENAPATERQKEFLRDLGVKFPDDIKSNQISMLLDAATDIRNQVSAGIWKQYEEQLKSAGMLVEHLSDEQLLDALRDRGKDFFVFLLEDDEFRYKDLPIKGQLRWSDSLNIEDVKYMLIKLAGEWARDLNLAAYTDDFDGSLPSIEFTADALAYQGTVVRLNIQAGGD